MLGYAMVLRFDADGEMIEAVDIGRIELLAPTQDTTDFFQFVAPSTLQRTSGETLGQWDAPASMLLQPTISAVYGEQRFATVGAPAQQAPGADTSTLWVGTLTLP